MYCCGSTSSGQLGLGGAEVEIYTKFVENKNLNRSCKQVAAGVRHSLFLTDEGSVYSCGCNDFEQLGHRKHNRKPELIDALNTQEHQQVCVGKNFSVVLSVSGQVFIFGSVSGDPSKQDKLYFNKPTRLKGFTSRILQIATGYHHLVALGSDGTIFSFGLNDFGQLGQGHRDTITAPTPIVSFKGIPASLVCCGAFHSLLITVSGAVFTFGSNSFGQLGVNGAGHSWPQHVKQLESQRSKYASCGENHTAIITLDGGVFTFGAGMYGQLGHSLTNNETLPRKVFELMGSVVTQIACGRCHTVAFVPKSGRLYAFGLGASGQLGIGEGVPSKSSPVNVPGPWTKSTGKQGHSEHPECSVYAIFAGGDGTFVRCTTKDKPAKDFRQISSSLRIPQLTLEVAKELAQVTAKKESHISPDLVSLINVLFGSDTCLNGSFLAENDDHMLTSIRHHGIDLKQAIDVFEKLRSVNSVIENMIVTNLGKMLASLPRSPPGLEALRIYVTLPFCHVFENKDFCRNIICAFTKSADFLSAEASKVLDHWYEEAQATFFDRALHVFKPIVLYILHVPPSSDESLISEYQAMLRSTLNFLSRLHHISSNAKCEIVSYDAFYIPELSEKISVEADYINWLRRPKSSQGHGPIAFCDYAFLFDGVAKCQLLQLDARMQRQMALNNAIDSNFAHAFGYGGSPALPVLRLIISRNRIVADTIQHLDQCAPEDLKKPLSVTFIGEEGVDAGGVKKEFFLLLMRELLDPKYGMFTCYDDTHSIWFNPHSFEETSMYKLVGKICGLAIYNETIIELPFPRVLYKKLLNDSRLSVEDMRDLSGTTYRSLQDILQYKGDDFADVYSLTMSLDVDAFGSITTVDLIPNGRNIPVTKENVREYVDAYIEYVFNSSVQRQFVAFYDGFHEVMSGCIVKLFQPSELMTMIVGSPHYDFELLEKHTEYKGVYYAGHKVIIWFWEVFRSFSVNDKKRFMVFLTGTDRIPMLGIKNFKIYIQPTFGGDNFYPVAHTCFNLLDLPCYSSKAILETKLREAIQHEKGFTLV